MTDFDSKPESAHFDEKRLRELTAAWYDDMISPADQAELQEMLLSAGAARSDFLDDMCLHAGMEWEIASRGKLATLINSYASADSGNPQTGAAAPPVEPRRSRASSIARRVLFLAVAASAMIAASTLFVPQVRQMFSSLNPAANVVIENGSPSTTIINGPVIANITPSSAGCRWMFEMRGIAEKPNGDGQSQVRAGETLRVTGGSLLLTFDHGTAVTLTAPAILEVDSPMRGRLIRGRATVKVAPGAEGFTIDTPRTSVVDLGTVFGVEVDDFGGTDVVVFSGIVDLTYSSDAIDSASTEVGKQRLYMGEAVRVDDRGTLSRIISLNSNRFAAGSAEPLPRSRKTVIASVRDNIERADTWNFYEIVPEGMNEDAKAFVDRLHHEWNGVEHKGMPGYLVGGDYVKTFNDDKNIGNKEVSVKLVQPATLYVLWCKRIPPPNWLREEFEETGDEIGVDEGRHVFKDGTEHQRPGPGVGPGESVDSIHTIWRRKVSKPGTVRLGPTEAPGWDFNVYGIVAVPLKKS